MNAQTKVNWGKDLNSLVAHADVAIQGRLAERKAAAGTVAHPCRLLHNLMKSLLREAQELNLGDRFQS